MTTVYQGNGIYEVYFDSGLTIEMAEADIDELVAESGTVEELTDDLEFANDDVTTLTKAFRKLQLVHERFNNGGKRKHLLEELEVILEYIDDKL